MLPLAIYNLEDDEINKQTNIYSYTITLSSALIEIYSSTIAHAAL